ncbi:hypothetical protein JXD20_02960 [Candidatus Peregrinibacteria bacterium]|nr:hypothetical protein [Candidatus Peregrinibacteria bacterium]
MTDTKTTITTDQLRKMLNESILSEELKTNFNEILEVMDNEGKAQLLKIIEESNAARATYEKEHDEKMVKLNTALEKHLKNNIREEEKYIREEFEAYGKELEEKEMQDVEQTINNI